MTQQRHFDLLGYLRAREMTGAKMPPALVAEFENRHYRQLRTALSVKLVAAESPEDKAKAFERWLYEVRLYAENGTPAAIRVLAELADSFTEYFDSFRFYMTSVLNDPFMNGALCRPTQANFVPLRQCLLNLTLAMSKSWFIGEDLETLRAEWVPINDVPGYNLQPNFKFLTAIGYFFLSDTTEHFFELNYNPRLPILLLTLFRQIVTNHLDEIIHAEHVDDFMVMVIEMHSAWENQANVSRLPNIESVLLRLIEMRSMNFLEKLDLSVNGHTGFLRIRAVDRMMSWRGLVTQNTKATNALCDIVTLPDQAKKTLKVALFILAAETGCLRVLSRYSRTSKTPHQLLTDLLQGHPNLHPRTKAFVVRVCYMHSAEALLDSQQYFISLPMAYFHLEMALLAYEQVSPPSHADVAVNSEFAHCDVLSVRVQQELSLAMNHGFSLLAMADYYAQVFTTLAAPGNANILAAKIYYVAYQKNQLTMRELINKFDMLKLKDQMLGKNIQLAILDGNFRLLEIPEETITEVERQMPEGRSTKLRFPPKEAGTMSDIYQEAEFFWEQMLSVKRDAMTADSSSKEADLVSAFRTKMTI